MTEKLLTGTLSLNTNTNKTFNSIKIAAHKERTFSHASYVQLCKAELLLYS